MGVTVDDIRVELGKQALTDTQSDQIYAWLWQVERLIRDHFPGATLNPDRVDDVVRWVVAARAQRPDPAKKSREVSVDDGRIVETYDQGDQRSWLDLLGDWWDYLASGSAGPDQRTAWSVRPAYRPDLRPGRQGRSR